MSGVSILFKRGLKAALPVEASFGEPIVATDTGELFMGQGPSQPLKRLTIDPELIQTIIDRPAPPALASGSNITLTQVGNTITIASTAGDTTVVNNPQTHEHYHYNYVVELQQIAKLGVVADNTRPKYVALDIVESLNLVRPPVGVLKFKASEIKAYTTLTYSNRDATDFVENAFMLYDGTMHMKVEYIPTIVDRGMLDVTYKLLEIPINKSDFKNIQRVEVFGYGASIHQ